MVVLKPILEGERSKVCSACSHLGICSPLIERTSFYRNYSGRGSKYRWNCRWCSYKAAKQYEAENHEHVLKMRRAARRRRRDNMTLEELEQKRAKERAYAARRKKEDPEYVARCLKQSREYKARNRERLRELRNIDRLLKKEKAGTWKVPPPEPLNITRKSGTLLPCGPVSNWLDALVSSKTKEYLAVDESPKNAKAKAVADVVRDLHTSTRSLYSWRYEKDVIDITIVDRLVLSHGGITLDEIYRNYGDGYSILIGSDFSYLRVDYWKPKATA